MKYDLITQPKFKSLLLLLLWLFIGTGLRLTQLAAKPPWTDEFSTLVFSLGNSFQLVPLNQAIALDVLLQPLQPNPANGIAQVVQHLLSESNHPPLYFILSHWWLELWQPDSVGLVSVWGARSLSALLGAASIPAIFGLSWLAFRSRLISHLTAATIAVSPYAIFLAQEARHYTLAILWVIASFCCLVIATRHIQSRTPLPVWVGASWILINILGISTHYFFSLTLCTEALVLIALRWKQQISKKAKFNNPNVPMSQWRQIYFVAVGTIIGGLVWLPVFLHSNTGELTQWIQSSDRAWLTWLNPIFQVAAAWITMLSLLPVEASVLPVVIASGAVMLIFFVWALPILYRGFKTLLKQPQTNLMTQLFAGIVCSAIALFFIFTYALDIDLTRGARYHFLYFPAVMVLVGASLAVCWNQIKKREGKTKQNFFSTGKIAVSIILLMGLLSAFTVVFNLGYQKYYRPDLLVQLIHKVSHDPVLIATTHKTHVQIGEMMGIAREFKLFDSANKITQVSSVQGIPNNLLNNYQLNLFQGELSATQNSKLNDQPEQAQNYLSANPQFLLAHQDQDPKTSTATLQQTLNQVSYPLDLWLVNFYAPLEVNNCVADTQSLPPIDGYNFQLYHCLK